MSNEPLFEVFINVFTKCCKLICLMTNCRWVQMEVVLVPRDQWHSHMVDV